MNWEGLLSELGVEYRTSGENCADGHVVINCPLCEGGDPSFHMGLDLRSGRWGCWRNSDHRGKNPYFLLGKLTSPTRARELLTKYGSEHKYIPPPPTPDDIEFSIPRGVFVMTEDRVNNDDSCYPAFSYMHERLGCSCKNNTFAKVMDYRIHYANDTAGKFTNRVFVPYLAFFCPEVVLSYTARYLGTPPSDKVARYLSSKTGEATKTSNLLFGEHLIKPGLTEMVILVEGPFDAMRLWAAMPPHYVTPPFVPLAVSGKEFNRHQANRLVKIARGKQLKVAILLDAGSVSSVNRSKNLAESLFPTFRLNISDFSGADDPGDMPHEDARGLFSHLESLL